MTALTVDVWQSYLQDLFPESRAWSAQDNKFLEDILAVIAVECNRADVYINNLKNEFNFALTTELIDEWECELDLPDACDNQTDDLTKRQKRLKAKNIARSTITAAKIIELAISFDLEITLTETSANNVKIILPQSTPTQFHCGISRCGDKLIDFTTDTPFECKVRALAPAQIGLTFQYQN